MGELPMSDALLYDEVAEKAILGTCLEQGIHPTLAATEFGLKEMLFDFRHTNVFEIVENQVAQGMVPSVVTVIQASPKQDPLYLKELLDHATHSDNLPELFRSVKEKYLARKVISACAKMQSDASVHTNIESRLYEFQAEILGLNPDSKRKLTRSEQFQEIINIYEDAFLKVDSKVGLKTGFSEIDKYLLGMLPGEVVVLAGRPSTGKTCLALNILENIAMTYDVPSVFFSFETKTLTLNMRTLARMSRTNISKALEGGLNEEEMQRLAVAVPRASSLPIEIEDCTGNVPIHELRAKARRIHSEKKIKVAVIDYIQLIESSKKLKNRNEEVAEVSLSIKKMAGELSIPIIVLSQFNRSMDKEKRRPRLSDLKESGAIEQDADKAILLYSDEESGDNEESIDVTAIIAKNKNGGRGDGHLTFKRAINTFEDNLKKNWGKL